MNNIRVDSLKWGTMYLVVRLLEQRDLSDYENWIKPSILTLVGFACFQLLIADNVQLGLQGKMNEVVSIALKFGTMLLVSAVLSGMSVNQDLLINIAIQIGGYSMASLFLNDLVGLNNMSGAQYKLMKDLLFFGGHAVFTQLVDSRSITDESFLQNTAFRLCGFAVYELFVSQF